MISGVVLLFTGRYPRQIYEFVMGMNRCVFRLAAYATLMTDAYSPVRSTRVARSPDTAPRRPI